MAKLRAAALYVLPRRDLAIGVEARHPEYKEQHIHQIHQRYISSGYMSIFAQYSRSLVALA